MLQGHVLLQTSHSCGACPVPLRVREHAEHGARPNTSPDGDDIPPLVDADDTDSDESNIGDAFTLYDPPENGYSEHVRAHTGALNWLRGVSVAQHGIGYSEVDPTVHEGCAAELPRYLAVVSHPPGAPPIAHYMDFRDYLLNKLKNIFEKAIAVAIAIAIK
jgi:hypothetical protein